MNAQDEMSWTGSENEEVYSSVMEGGTPRLLSVEEKWQIIFNEKTRAPIYAVSQYIEYLGQFVNGKSAASRDSGNVIKKDGINPISYLLRKLKLDMKMSYDSFVEEFLKPGNNGMSYLVKLLKLIQETGSQQSGSTNMTQLKNYKKTLTDEHDCLLCIKYALRLRSALSTLLEITYGAETVSMSLLSTFTKSRGTAIEILTVALSLPEGFSRILDCFTFIRLKIGEPVRFKSLINMMNMDSVHNVIFKVSTMKFINCLLDASTNMNIRVYLQYELESAGLDVGHLQETASGNGLEHDDLRQELETWQRKYINVESLMSTGSHVVSAYIEQSHLETIEELKRQVRALDSEKSLVEQKLKAVRAELKICFEELQARTPFTKDMGVQCGSRPPEVTNVGCQAAPSLIEAGNPLETAAQYFGWRGSTLSDAISYSEEHVYANEGDIQEGAESDEERTEKVHHWLQSHYSSESDLDILPHCVTDSHTGSNHTFYFQRQNSIRRKPRKADFPGNWKLVPKSTALFPSRFPAHQCHKTNCDRCDIRNRPENKQIHRRQIILQTVTADVPSTSAAADVTRVKQTAETKSQSSDSAIGGSGERLWNHKNRRIALTPTEKDEAEFLQDMIQPDDSASGVVMMEPFPDYSVLGAKYSTQKSYKTELSKVLRDFEGSLKTYENQGKVSNGEMITV